MFRSKAAVAVLLAFALTACGGREGEIHQTGITTIYTACPPVAIPVPTGDITLFDPPGSTNASAIDVVATITNLRGTCDETGEYIVTTATFEIVANRRDNRGVRDVVLPYFATVVQGGENVVAKQVSRAGLRFEDGEYRASTTASATSRVLRSAATLPEDIRRQITRERRPGDPDAALDPMADPAVRAAVRRASFEMLIGFELSEEQLRYNATR